MLSTPRGKQGGSRREELSAAQWTWHLGRSTVPVATLRPARLHRGASPRGRRGDPWAVNEQPGLPGKTSTVHAGLPTAECMKLVICLPRGHVTMVRWISEGRKAFDTSLHSVKTLTRVAGTGGGGPCRLLGAPTPGKTRLGRGGADERHLAPFGGSSSIKAHIPPPRGPPPGQRAGEAATELGRTPRLELGTQIGSLSSGPSADPNVRIPPPPATLTSPGQPWLCELGHVTWCLCALVSSSVKRGS